MLQEQVWLSIIANVTDSFASSHTHVYRIAMETRRTGEMNSLSMLLIGRTIGSFCGSFLPEDLEIEVVLRIVVGNGVTDRIIQW